MWLEEKRQRKVVPSEKVSTTEQYLEFCFRSTGRLRESRSQAVEGEYSFSANIIPHLAKL